PRPAIAPTTPLSMPARRIPTAALAFGGIGAFLFGMVMVVGVGGLGLFWLTRPPADRPVRVVAAGVDPARFDVDLATGQPGSVADDGARLFAGVAPGEIQVRWAAGSGCDATACSAGSCEPWCTHGEQVVAMDPGGEAFVVELAPTMPAPRVVDLGVPEGAVVAFSTLGAAPGERTATGVRFTGVEPGVHRASIVLQGCPDADTSCRVTDAPVTVPVEGPADPPSFALTAPAPVALPAPAPGPATARPGRGLVKSAALQQWLDQHPEFVAYSWAGKDEGGTARGVPPAIADAYCRDTANGLATPDDPPTPTYLEIRRRSGQERPYWAYDENGPVGPLSLDQVLSPGGTFRCRR
ncbi:MAG: hypothetical protein ABMA64_08565, partial [Myxococcota bacterium]